MSRVHPPPRTSILASQRRLGAGPLAQPAAPPPVLVSWPAACAAFWFSGLRPAESDAAPLRAELARAQAPARPAARGPQSAQESLARFYRAFASRDRAYEALRGVFHAAEAEHLALDKGEYRLARERGADLLRADRKR